MPSHQSEGARFLPQHSKRVPATPALKGWENLETSFHLNQVFQFRESRESRRQDLTGWQVMPYATTPPVGQSRTLEHWHKNRSSLLLTGPKTVGTM